MLTAVASILLALSGSESAPLPASLAEDYRFPEDVDILDPEGQYVPPPSKQRPGSGSGSQFSIGPAGGYLHARGADRGAWFVGGQARLHFLQVLAAEVSMTFHENRYENGDIQVTQYPVQVSGMLYPFPNWIVSPYLVGGAGWYYSRVTYSGARAGTSDLTDHTFGAHGGLGADVRLGGSFTIDADFRYIFLDPSGTQVQNGHFNYWQVTFGLNLLF